MYICNSKGACPYPNPKEDQEGSVVFVTEPNGERNRTYERVLMLQTG